MTDSNRNTAGKSKLTLWITLGVIGILVLLYLLAAPFREGVHQGLAVLASGDQDRLSQWVEQFGILGPIVIVLSMVIQMFLLVIPSLALMVVAVLAYGGFWGTLISLLAVFAASTVGYFIGLWLGPHTVDKLIGRKTEQKVEHYVDKYGFWAVVVARFAPFMSNDAISFVGGILKMGYIRFIAATLLGTLPLAVAIAFMGQNTESLKTGMWWLGGISLILFIAWVIYDRRHKQALSRG